MFTLGLIVLVVIASATTVIATSIVSTPVISVAAIVSAAVLALVRSDAIWSIYAAPIVVTAVISAATVSATSIAAGLTLIWSTTIDSFLTIAITTGLALIGTATGRSVATGIAIFRAVSARLTAIASRAFFLSVVTNREGHLGW